MRLGFSLSTVVKTVLVTRYLLSSSLRSAVKNSLPVVCSWNSWIWASVEKCNCTASIKNTPQRKRGRRRQHILTNGWNYCCAKDESKLPVYDISLDEDRDTFQQHTSHLSPKCLNCLFSLKHTTTADNNNRTDCFLGLRCFIGVLSSFLTIQDSLLLNFTPQAQNQKREACRLLWPDEYISPLLLLSLSLFLFLLDSRCLALFHTSSFLFGLCPSLPSSHVLFWTLNTHDMASMYSLSLSIASVCIF